LVRDFDANDPAMGDGTAHECHVAHTVEPEVADVTANAAQESPIFFAL